MVNSAPASSLDDEPLHRPQHVSGPLAMPPGHGSSPQTLIPSDQAFHHLPQTPYGFVIAASGSQGPQFDAAGLSDSGVDGYMLAGPVNAAERFMPQGTGELSASNFMASGPHAAGNGAFSRPYSVGSSHDSIGVTDVSPETTGNSSIHRRPTLMHRASISGPIMTLDYATTGHPPTVTEPVLSNTIPQQGARDTIVPGFAAVGGPPSADHRAAWVMPTGATRPHTAEGLYGSGGLPMPLLESGGYPAMPNLASAQQVGRPPLGSNVEPQAWSQHGYHGDSLWRPDLGLPPKSNGLEEVSGPSTYGDLSVGSAGDADRKKRPRRKHSEIDRMYRCGFEGCDKSYGTLNHLNAHVALQKHGEKRTPQEFREMRRAWRAKRKDEQRRLQFSMSGGAVLGAGRHSSASMDGEASASASASPAAGPGMMSLGHPGLAQQSYTPFYPEPPRDNGSQQHPGAGHLGHGAPATNAAFFPHHPYRREPPPTAMLQGQAAVPYPTSASSSLSSSSSSRGDWRVKEEHAEAPFSTDPRGGGGESWGEQYPRRMP
ncbi:unnamed protein product [Parajaminaea phylloscopi]